MQDISQEQIFISAILNFRSIPSKSGGIFDLKSLRTLCSCSKRINNKVNDFYRVLLSNDFKEFSEEFFKSFQISPFGFYMGCVMNSLPRGIINLIVEKPDLKTNISFIGFDECCYPTKFYFDNEWSSMAGKQIYNIFKGMTNKNICIKCKAFPFDKNQLSEFLDNMNRKRFEEISSEDGSDSRLILNEKQFCDYVHELYEIPRTFENSGKFLNFVDFRKEYFEWSFKCPLFFDLK